MEKDEQGTIARQQAHREKLIGPEVTEHHGRIVKTMGDGLLIEFPSVVEAFQCALDIQNGMAERNMNVADTRKMLLRIGINVGDVILEGDDVLGDGVILAAILPGNHQCRRYSRFRDGVLPSCRQVRRRTRRRRSAKAQKYRPTDPYLAMACR